jgi:hypothetical protein
LYQTGPNEFLAVERATNPIIDIVLNQPGGSGATVGTPILGGDGPLIIPEPGGDF